MRDTTERRIERRRLVFLRAMVYGAGENEEFECAIQDASRSGCKIISDELHRLPDDICLTIRGLGDTFFGRVVWRKGTMAGVQFISEAEHGNGAKSAPAR